MSDAGERPRLIAPASKLLLLLGIVALAWVTIGVTFGTVLGARQPLLAMAVWGGSAETRTAAALQLSGEGEERREAAEALLLDAVRREPGHPGAMASLAALHVVKGNEEAAERTFRFAEALSRRDFSVQMFLIEASAGRGDVSDTLRHFDRALRTSSSAPHMLYPILVSALEEPLVRRQVAHLLSTRPPWWQHYYATLLERNGSPQGLAALTLAVRLDKSDPAEHALLLDALKQLVASGEYVLAHGVYAAAQGTSQDAALIRPIVADGSLGTLPPFDWELTDTPGFGAVAESRSEVPGGVALSISNEPSRSGEVARQLLQLAPGTYELSLTAGDVQGAELERPRIAVRCAGRTGETAALMSTSLPAIDGEGRQMSYEFTVPQRGCNAQWVSVAVGSILDPKGANPWVAGISVDRS